MKKLKFITASAAIAALTLTACQNDVDFTQEDVQNAAAAAVDDNAIQFGTYLSENMKTRAGYKGSITNNRLKDLTDDGSAVSATTNGFGVFAYYTGSNDYNATNGTSATLNPNFMYNQQVKWNKDLGDSYITKWTYSPLKYWPNEVANVTAAAEANGQAGNDDQENDANTNPSFTATPRGNVSFFAYAPYVDFSSTDPTGLNQGTDGIIAINAKTDVSGNSVNGDPILTYKVAADTKNTVDLLWGVYDNTSKNVNESDNTGVTSTANNNPVVSTPIDSRTSYAADILQGYTTNADLTKQKTNGTINFLFKHALAKVGGGNAGATTTPDGKKIHKGLMVVLDIDDMQGAEQGGVRETFETNYNRTIVTIKDIKISNDLNGAESGNKITINGTTYPSSDDSKELKTTGLFDLATGKWTLTEFGNVTQTIGTTDDKVSTPSDNGEYSATLEESLREYKALDSDASPDPVKVTYVSTFGSKKEYFNKTSGHEGVTETPKNVFEDDNESPLVFIPGQTPVLRFDIDYVVRTYDENLALGYSEVEQKISKIITLPEALILNRQYNILMHLGLTGVKFTASVSNWDDYKKDGSENYDSDGDGSYDITVTDVYVPRNVSGLIVSGMTTTLASNQAAQTLDIKYFIDQEPQGANDATLDKISGDDILTYSASTLTTTANGTFTAKTASYQFSKGTITSDVITFTQLPLIAKKAKVTFTTPVASTVAYNVTNVDYSALTVEAAAKESDNSTDHTNVAPTSSETGNIIFIDDATGLTASWISHDKANNKFVLQENETGADRTAKLYIQIGGVLVPVVSDLAGDSQVTITQNKKP